MNNNIVNGGLIFKQGGRTFAADLQNYSGTYMEQDGRRILLDGMFWFMNEAGGWIYYSDQKKGNSLFRFDPGTQRVEEITDRPAYGLTLSGDWLYYINESDNKLYRCPLDGKRESKVIDDEVDSFFIDGEQIYYTTGQGIRTCSVTGSDRELVSDHLAVHLVKLGMKLIFADKKNHYSLTVLDPVTGVAETHTDITPNSLNSDGRYLYCANRSNESSVYRIDPVSGTKIRICGESADYLHIVEESIYFCNNREWYRISLSGGQAVKVFKNQEAEV